MHDTRYSPGEPEHKRSHRRWYYALAAITVIVVAVLIILPFVIRSQIIKQLKGMGADEVVISNVDFNPFTGTLVIYDMLVTNDGEPTLETTRIKLVYSYLPLFSKRLNIEELSIDKAGITIEKAASGALITGGLSPGAPAPEKTSEEKPKSPWGIGIDRFSIADMLIRFITPQASESVRIDRLVVEDIKSWDGERAGSIDFSGAVNDASLTISADVTPFAVEPAAVGRLKLDALALAPFRPFAADGVDAIEGSVYADIGFEAGARPGGAFNYAQKGTLEVRGLNTIKAGMNVAGENISWKGTLRMNSPGKGHGKPTAVASGSLTGKKTTLSMPEEALVVRHDLADWKGEFAYGVTDAPGGFRVNGDLTLDGITVDMPGKGVRALEVARLGVEKISAEGTSEISTKKIGFEKIRSGVLLKETAGGPAKPPLVSASTIDILDTKISGLKNTSIKSITIKDLGAHLYRGPDGRISVVERLSGPGAADKGAEAEKAVKPAGKKDGAVVSISRIDVTGKSLVHFEDHTSKPPFTANINLTKVTLRGLDSGKKKPGKVDIDAKLGEYTDVSVSGTVSPFAPRLTLDVSGKLKSLDLPPLTPYTVRNLGYNLKSGHLNADVKLKITNGVMDGTSELLINNLTVEPKDQSKLEKLTTQLAMPLETALNLLRSKDDNIRLTLPVKGDISSPEISFADVINKAMGNAMKKAAVGYLKYYFQPFGTLITIGQYAGEKISRVSLDPVLFAPGSTELDETATAYMEKIAGLMKDRPGLNIKVCGIAVAGEAEMIPEEPDKAVGEKPAATEQAIKAVTPEEAAKTPEELAEIKLNRLAEERSAVIKSYLVSNLGVDPGRLFICHPDIDRAEGGKPRAELLI